MTNAELLTKIKAEIERRLLEKDHGFEDEADYGYHCCLKDIKQFLSTLESEKPMEQEGLEEEIERYLPNIPENPYNEELRVFARHFAKWGAEHLKK